MKSLKFLISTLLLVFVTGIAPAQTDSTATDTATAVVDTTPAPPDTVAVIPAAGKKTTVIEFLKREWANILLWFIPLLWFIVRLTPTKKDDDIVKIVLSWLDAIVPNRKADGGVHATYTDASTAPKIAFVPKK